MTFVRTKLRLERMQPGDVLHVRLRGDEPLRNVPRAARDEGMTFLRECAVRRVFEGVTTLREINKVTFVE